MNIEYYLSNKIRTYNFHLTDYIYKKNNNHLKFKIQSAFIHNII